MLNAGVKLILIMVDPLSKQVSRRTVLHVATIFRRLMPMVISQRADTAPLLGANSALFIPPKTALLLVKNYEFETEGHGQRFLDP